MVLLSVLTKKAHPRIGYVYKVGKLSYKVNRCTTWLGKVETIASYVLGLVSSRLAWTWITVKWVWSNRRKTHWSQLAEEYLLSLVPPNVPLSADLVRQAACFDGDAVNTNDYWFKKAGLVYLAECFARHTAHQQLESQGAGSEGAAGASTAGGVYVSTQLLADPEGFPVRSCLQGFFSSPHAGALVKLARSRPGQLQSVEFWQQEVPALATAILKDVDSRLVKDVAELCLL